MVRHRCPGIYLGCPYLLGILALHLSGRVGHPGYSRASERRRTTAGGESRFVRAAEFQCIADRRERPSRTSCINDPGRHHSCCAERRSLPESESQLTNRTVMDFCRAYAGLLRPRAIFRRRLLRARGSSPCPGSHRRHREVGASRGARISIGRQSGELYVGPHASVVRRPQRRVRLAGSVEADHALPDLQGLGDPYVVDAPIEPVPIRM